MNKLDQKNSEIEKSFNSSEIMSFEDIEIAYRRGVFADGKKVVPRYTFNSGFVCSSVVLPDSYKIVSEGAFCGSKISSFVGRGLERINKYAFSGCENLSTVELGNGLKSIGTEAFKRCWSLQGISIPPTVKEVGDHIFKGCICLSWLKCGKSFLPFLKEIFIDCPEIRKFVIVSNNGKPIASYNRHQMKYEVFNENERLFLEPKEKIIEDAYTNPDYVDPDFVGNEL